MTLKQIGAGLLAVVVAALALWGFLAWFNWAFRLGSAFWFIALSPIGLLCLILGAVVFVFGATIAKRKETL